SRSPTRKNPPSTADGRPPSNTKRFERRTAAHKHWPRSGRTCWCSPWCCCRWNGACGMGTEAVPEFARPGWLVLIAAAVLLVVLSLRGRRRAQARDVTAGTLRTLALAALVVA